MFGFLKSWLFVLVIFLAPSTVQAASCLMVPASHAPTAKGPGYDLQQDGFSIRALKFLRHPNGRIIRRSEDRRLHDAHYCLPENIKQLLAKNPPKARRATASRAVQTAALRRQIESRINTEIVEPLKRENANLKQQISHMVDASQLQKAQKDLADQKVANQNKISAYWLILAAIIAGLLSGFIFYHRGRESVSEEEIISRPVSPDLATAIAQKKSETERANRAEAQRDELRDKWTDLRAVRSQLEKLEAEATHRSVV